MTIQDEIESFFDKASTVVFCEPEREQPNGESLVYLFFTGDEFSDFLKTDIHQKVSAYFQNKKSKLLIFIKDNSPYKMAIVDKESGNSINISNISFDESINDFIELTAENEKLVLLTAYLSSREFLLHYEAVKNPHVVLDGYSLVYN